MVSPLPLRHGRRGSLLRYLPLQIHLLPHHSSPVWPLCSVQMQASAGCRGELAALVDDLRNGIRELRASHPVHNHGSHADLSFVRLSPGLTLDDRRHQIQVSLRYGSCCLSGRPEPGLLPGPVPLPGFRGCLSFCRRRQRQPHLPPQRLRYRCFLHKTPQKAAGHRLR